MLQNALLRRVLPKAHSSVADVAGKGREETRHKPKSVQTFIQLE